MTTELMDPPMTTEKSKPKTLSVKLHTDVIDSARVVSALRGEPMQDMISDILRPILTRMEHEEIGKRAGSIKRKVGGK
jgi:hypothetical protein